MVISVFLRFSQVAWRCETWRRNRRQARCLSLPSDHGGALHQGSTSLLLPHVSTSTGPLNPYEALLVFRDRKSKESTCISKPERFYNQLARLLAKRGKKDFSMKIQVIQPALLYFLLSPRIFHEVWRLWSSGLSSNGTSRASHDRTWKPG